jgi:membrane protein DedA with SNARE-associated domain/rhodanese-related sulfurtransferase
VAENLMNTVVSLIAQYGLLVVFVSVLLDESGLPLPSYPALIVAGAVYANHGNPLLPILLAAIAGSLVADAGWYWASVHYGRRVLSLLCRISLSPDSCVRQTESVFVRVGPWSLLFAKFVPGLGNITVALAGMTRIGWPRFLALDAIGAALYLIVPVALGALFHNAIRSVLDTLAELGKVGLSLVVLALVLYLAARWVQRQLFIRQLRMDRISVDELAAMLDGGETPIILDVRPSAVRLRDGIIPGALSAHPEDSHPSLETLARDREIVIYCACPNEASAAIAAQHLRRAGFRKIRPLLGGVDAWQQAGHRIELAA